MIKMADNNNIFLNPRANKIDVQIFGALTVTLIVFIIGYLQSSSLQNFGSIYFDLASVTFIFLSVAILSKNKVFAFVFWGKERTTPNFFFDAAIGIGLGLVLNYGLIQGFSISIPLAISNNASVATGSVSHL